MIIEIEHQGFCSESDWWEEQIMPAIAPIEDLRATQKEGLSIYAMLYALCSMLYEDGAILDGKISVSHGFRSALQNNLKEMNIRLLYRIST